MAYACPDWLKCCFTSTEIVGLLGTGVQDVHLDFHTAPELHGKEQESNVLYLLEVDECSTEKQKLTALPAFSEFSRREIPWTCVICRSMEIRHKAPVL